LIVVFCDKKENVQTKKSKVLVVSGPTAAGKSRLAFKLATLLNGELINVDSVKVLNLMKKEQYRMNLSLISKYDTL
jgi:ATP-dependent protease Clp ATPase subunit